MLNKFVHRFAVAAFACIVSVAGAQSVKGSITLPSQPEGVGINFLTNRIYVAVPSSVAPTDSVVVIDGKSDSVIGSISVPTIAQQVAVDVVRNVIYVGGYFTDANGIQQSQVVAINGWTNKVGTAITVTTTDGLGLQSLAVNPYTGTLYVANASDNAIDVINYGSHAINAQIPVESLPLGVAVNFLTNQVYAALANSTIDVIDGSKNTITTTTTIGNANAGIAANLVTGNVFVTNNVFGRSTTAVLNKAGGVLANVAVGNTPFGVDVDFGTNLAFVTNTQDGTVSVIDGKTNTVSKSLAVSGLYIAVNPITEKVYVGGQGNSLTVLSEK